MTSSLVGSEMCIRDSLMTTTTSTTTTTTTTTTTFFRTGLARDACDREAVSYTHLTLPTICSV
eukprot:2221615-Prorocentrum_lima.AAC.1